MVSQKKVDMTKGPIMQLVILFALPICIGNVLQQLYNTVDTLVIGNFCNSVSLAAVGTSTQPVEIFLCLFLGIGFFFVFVIMFLFRLCVRNRSTEGNEDFTRLCQELRQVSQEFHP